MYNMCNLQPPYKIYYDNLVDEYIIPHIIKCDDGPIIYIL